MVVVVVVRGGIADAMACCRLKLLLWRMLQLMPVLVLLLVEIVLPQDGVTPPINPGKQTLYLGDNTSRKDLHYVKFDAQRPQMDNGTRGLTHRFNPPKPVARKFSRLSFGLTVNRSWV